jgi:Na+-driven multidrug efflux pump
VHQSQLFAKLAVITVAVLAISLSIIFTLLKPLIVPLFSANEEVAYWFAIVYDLYVHYYIFPDSYQANLSAILRSVGKQNFAASSFMIVYYGIGIPLSFFFVFVCNFGMPGVWYAEIVLGVAACSTFYWKISTLDWQGSIDEVSARLELEA